VILLSFFRIFIQISFKNIDFLERKKVDFCYEIFSEKDNKLILWRLKKIKIIKKVKDSGRAFTIKGKWFGLIYFCVLVTIALL